MSPTRTWKRWTWGEANRTYNVEVTKCTRYKIKKRNQKMRRRTVEILQPFAAHDINAKSQQDQRDDYIKKSQHRRSMLSHLRRVSMFSHVPNVVEHSQPVTWWQWGFLLEGRLLLSSDVVRSVNILSLDFMLDFMLDFILDFLLDDLFLDLHLNPAQKTSLLYDWCSSSFKSWGVTIPTCPLALFFLSSQFKNSRSTWGPIKIQLFWEFDQ